MEARTGRDNRRVGRGMGATMPPDMNCSVLDQACVNTNVANWEAYNKQVAAEQGLVYGDIPQATVPVGSIAYPSTIPTVAPIAGSVAGAYSAPPPTAVATYNPVGGTYASTTQPLATTVALHGGQFTFSPSRSGALYPGDTWNITIRGASPGLQVSASGMMQGRSFNSIFGVTDANGNFTLSGTIGIGDVGDWQEDWYVSSVKSGSANFTVVPKPVAHVVTQSSQTTPLTQNVTNTDQTASPASTQSVFGLFGDTSPVLFGVVNEYTALGIAAALVVGFMVMKGRR
jgi:hypothetical protein